MKNLVVNASGAYRPDVDGLRAAAVLSVVLFHIDHTLLPGGFIGVDIFFVISGFLISRNIIQDIERDRFSLLDFYRRRVKRIAPAMLVVVFVTVVVAQILILPEDAERAAESALWSLLSLSNVYFWLHQDVSYFAADSKELPLLHFWSLGVEEQFYLIWPLLLLVFYRVNRIRTIFIAMAIAGALSFVLGEAVFDEAPLFAYYMLPTRAGELLVGALVAIAVLKNADRLISGYLVEAMAWFGLALVVGSFFLLSESGAFPGLRAIPPTLGTAFVILAGNCRENSLSRALSLRPMVWIGLVSYSAYLWHWPLLAFLRYGYGDVTPAVGTIAFVVTFFLAWLSYKYVEQPARRSSAPFTRTFLQQYVLPAGVLGFISLGAMYIDGYGLRGVLGSYRADLETLRRQSRPAFTYDYVCQKQKIGSEDLVDQRCVVGAAFAGPPEAIMWGDSHASHYVGMVARFAQKAGFKFSNVAVGSCPPIDDDPEGFVERRRLSDCRHSLRVIRSFVSRFPVVIVSSAWTGYNYDKAYFLETFMKTAERLAKEGKLVIVIGNVPPISGFDQRCKQKSLSFPFLECPNVSRPIDENVSAVNESLRDFARRTENVEYFDANDVLCPNGKCSAFESDGTPQYVDQSHLTLETSWKLGEMVLERGGLPEPFRMVREFIAHRTAN